MVNEHRYRVTRSIAVVLCAAVAGILVLAPVSDWVTYTVFDNLVEAAAAALAAAACFWRARREAPLRRSWYLLALACGAWFAGQMVWTWHELVRGIEVPFPSLADTGYLAAVPLAGAGLLVHRGRGLRRAAAARTLLDGTIIATSVLFVSWATVLGPAFREGSGGLVEQALALAYPIGDIVIISLGVFMLAGDRGATRRPLALVATGFVAIAFADSAFAYATQVGSYESITWVDAGWVTGFVLIALGALHPERTRGDRSEDTVGSRRRAVLPYVPVAAALLVAAAETLSGEGLDTFMNATVFVLAAAVVGRQLMAVMEQADVARHLEVRVEERTRELHQRERQFASLVQNGSDVILIIGRDAVIRYASPSSARVLGHDGGALMGKSLDEIVHAEDRDQIRPVVRAAEARPAAVVTAEWRFRHGGGGLRWMELKVTSQLHDDAVAGVVLSARDVSERREFEEQLRHQAFHDGLTGLANRALFRDRLEHALVAMRRSGERVGVLLLDLDDFKTINDTAGHGTGDELLEVVAIRLASLLRPGDTVARLGGDEFAVLAPGLTDDDEVDALAARILDGMRQPLLVDGRELYVHASIGSRVADGGGSTPDDLLREADVAMYVAKGEGKGCHRAFDPAMHERLMERMELQADLAGGLEGGQFSVVYQPVVSLPHHHVIGVEALARWDHPVHGAVSPVDFIPIAEESGFIVELGAWVLQAACEQLRTWRSAFSRWDLDMHVNVSVRQLVEPGLVDRVRAVLASTGVPPEHVVLEITESMLMENSDALVDVLHELRRTGVHLAIDDFGTGYSSLAYLARLPVDKIKIDGSFVAALEGGSATSRSMVQSIVKLGHEFSLSVVAEGIEETAWAERLETMGCDEGQGYLFARPMSAADVTTMLFSEQGEFTPTG